MNKEEIAKKVRKTELMGQAAQAVQNALGRFPPPKGTIVAQAALFEFGYKIALVDNPELTPEAYALIHRAKLKCQQHTSS